MKQFSTMMLRCAVILAGAAIFAVCCIFGWIAFFENKSDPYYIEYIGFIGTCGAAVPFYIVLYRTMKLLEYIDEGCAFSELSVKALESITRCACIVFMIVTVCGLPFFYILVQLDGDTPGFMLLGILISVGAFFVTVFASVLKRLLQDAVALKSENELTI